jgi:hypothetical protein
MLGLGILFRPYKSVGGLGSEHDVVVNVHHGLEVGLDDTFDYGKITAKPESGNRNR